MNHTSLTRRIWVRAYASAGSFARATVATTYRLFLENVRAYPWSFATYRFLLSLFQIAIAYLIYHELFAGETLASFQQFTGSDDYITFVVVGISIQVYANSALLSLGRSLIVERRMRTIESLLLTPSAQTSYLLGTMLQQTVLATVDFLIILAMGVAFGADVSQVNWLGFAVAIAVGQVGFMGMGVLLSAVMLYLRDTYLTQNTVLVVLLFICGVLFPIEYLPLWIQRIAQGIPYTHVLRLTRESALLGYGIAQQRNGLIFVLFLSLLYYLVGYVGVRRVRYIALEKSLS